MKVLVTGGRVFGVIPRGLIGDELHASVQAQAERDFLFAQLDALHKRCGFTELAHGGAKGVDTLAGIWAQSRNVPFRVFEANWSCHGSLAGPIRNSLMLREFAPDLVVAFPGGSGTENMVQLARRDNITVTVRKMV